MQWHLTLEESGVSEEALLSLRQLRSDGDRDEDRTSLDELKIQVGKAFILCPVNADRFQLVLVRCFEDFELKPGGRKVVCIDRLHEDPRLRSIHHLTSFELHLELVLPTSAAKWSSSSSSKHLDTFHCYTETTVYRGQR